MAETRELTLHIDGDVDDRLTGIARSTGRDTQSLARDALIEWLEDQEDIRDAMEVIGRGDRPIPLEEVKRNLDLARCARPVGGKGAAHERPHMVATPAFSLDR